MFFCTSKETISKTQPSEWEKLIANDTTAGLISRIYKQLIELNIKKINSSIKNMGGRPKHNFFHREDTEMANKDMKRWSALLIIQFSPVTQSCLTLWDPMDCNMPGLPIHHQLAELLILMPIESVMPPNHFTLCCPLLLLPSVFPSIRVFSNDSVL